MGIISPAGELCFLGFLAAIFSLFVFVLRFLRLPVWSRLGPSSAFDYVVDGGLVKQGKPHPEIFLRAASALMVDPASCVGIEDAVAGIQSIQGAGMCAVAVRVESRLPPCDLVVATTADLSVRALESAFSAFRKRKISAARPAAVNS
jgi:Haloacid dehalogenase-like hydrolase